MTSTPDLVARLRAKRLEGSLSDGILMDEAADRLESLSTVERERDEARTLVTEANNSLYGSQGYFHSLNGGPFDKYHLATGVENLKASSRKQGRELTASQAEVARLTEALKPFADLARLLDSARATLQGCRG